MGLASQLAPFLAALLLGKALRGGWDNYHRLSCCTDVYTEPLRPHVYGLDEMDPFVAPGLPVHMTAAGHKFHGTRDIEVWLQTLRPGQSTPIHNHDCEEINIVLRGEGTAYHRRADGTKVGRPMPTNSSALAKAGTIYQVSNTGKEALSVLVVMGCTPASITVHKDFDDPAAEATRVFPMFWDRACPTRLPAALPVMQPSARAQEL